ncbi:MAG: type II secretion system protein N [Gammaproteobacteria bacterium]
MAAGMRRRGLGRWLALALAALLPALLVAAVFAPASWADRAIDRASLGRVRLADAEGTVWRGQGRLVIADPSAASGEGPVVEGFALPGTVDWQLSVLPLMLGIIDASLSIGSMPEPVSIGGHPAEVRIGAGSLDLPSVELSRLGSPWNTIRPSAALSLRWDSLTIRQGVLDGRVSIELRDAASAMTPVRPLGSYRIDVTGTGQDVSLGLRTLSGPLKLEGSGQWARRAGLNFTASASAEGAEKSRLQSLLALIGRREGDRTIIRIGG